MDIISVSCVKRAALRAARAELRCWKAALTSSAGQSHNMSSSWFLGRDSIEEMLSDKVSHGWWQHHLLDEEDVGEIYHHR